MDKDMEQGISALQNDWVEIAWVLVGINVQETIYDWGCKEEMQWGGKTTWRVAQVEFELRADCQMNE